MLEHLCSVFDEGKTEAALWIAVILRTLLYTNDNGRSPSLSMIDQLKNIDSKYDIQFLSTCFPNSGSAGVMGWEFCDNINGICMEYQSIYAGLLIKTLKRNPQGDYVLDVRHKSDCRNEHNHYCSLTEWMQEKVFIDFKEEFKLNRVDAIRFVANKDGGAHFESKIPDVYATFRHPEMAKIYCRDTVMPFTKNPVYVSVRQMAWEVHESLSHANII